MVIRLIVGGALGTAFSVSLMLPGAVVFPEEPPIRHLAAPNVPSTIVVRAAPVAAPKKAPAPRRVVVRPVYVPTIRTAPTASVVRHPPSRSKPSPKPIPRTSPPAQQRLTQLSARPAEHATARKPKKAKKEEEGDENRGHGRDRGDKDKEKGKEKDKGKGKDDEGDDDEGGRGRGDDSAGG
jgi:hypothetical protein